MNTKKFYYLMIAGIVLLCFGIVAIAYQGNMIFKNQSERLSDLKAQSEVTSQQKTSLVQARKDIATYSELDTIAKTIVPQDKDQAKTVREINNIAKDSDIEIKQIAFTSSTLGLQTQSAAQVKTNDNSDESTPKPKQPATPAISQVKPVDGITGVGSLEISIQSGDAPVSYYKFLKFLERLESNRRTAHVTNISVSPSAGGSLVTFSLTLNAYVRLTQ
jgi:hypothetical protein